MRALVISHDELSLPGAVGERLEERGVALDHVVLVHELVPPHHLEPLPPLDGIDLVVPLGAPYSVHDPELAHVVEPELTFLRAAHQADIPILGICFGAQAMAAALGGRVERAPRPEIGWFEIDTDDASSVPPGPWFQWHVDRFDVPPQGVELARSPVGPQAFRIGRSLGVQFHPEVDRAIIESWVAHGGAEQLVEEGIDVADLLDGFSVHHADARRRAHRLVDAFLDALGPR